MNLQKGSIMEDYDINAEMKDIKTILMAVDKDDYIYFQNNVLSNDNVELMPIRLSYSLDEFSDEYINKTRELFIYYYNNDNSYDNELLRIKKHFKHYQRVPSIVYIPFEYIELRKMFDELNIKVISSLKEVNDYIKSVNKV